MVLFALSLSILCPLPVPVMTPPVDRMLSAAADTSVVEARAALARGQPWRASRLLAPVLADSARRTPEVILLGATAASRWGGWAEVRRLLLDQSWLDARDAGAGRALLARAQLETDHDSAAAAEARLGVASAGSDVERARRRVIRARALDRLDSLPSAASAYADAAEDLPQIREWLLYRAAIVTPDSAVRASRFAALARAPVRDHLQAAFADAALRRGDSAAAAEAYAGIGEWSTAYRLRLALAQAGPARDSLRSELIQVIRSAPGTGRARAAVDALDAGFPSLPASAELEVGRALASTGPSGRVVDAFHAAFAAGLGGSRERWDYARALFNLGRYAEAAAQFARVKAPASLAASAAYQRARALVRGGELSAGRTALRRLVRDYPHETDPAATALFLLGDLATDEGRDLPARDAFRTIVARYPRARLAPEAAFRAATITLVAGQPRAAALEFDSLASRYEASPEALAATYWAGRAWARAGDSARAADRWGRTTTRDSTGYYGALAARRLGHAPWAPDSAKDTFVAVPDADSALARVRLLRELGMDREARWELDALTSDPGTSVERLLALAAALREADEASRSIRLTWRALAAGAPRDARTYRLLYPVRHRAALEAEARRQGVPPAFAAALIRQESNFTPSATSRAGARGLMQLLPSVGHAVARSLGYPLWDPVLLYEPDVNLELGMAHLGELLRRYGTPVRVLAAYNAGGTRVNRWDDKDGSDDVEIFAERIPYPETRDYVRIIQRNLDFYQALYRWGPMAAPAGD